MIFAFIFNANNRKGFLLLFRREMEVMTKQNKHSQVVVKDLLNGAIEAVNQVIPLKPSILKPESKEDPIELSFGVLIGFVGDIKGKIMFVGDAETFANIGEVMFGMPVEGEMLTSFSGELGNMIAGNLSTNIHAKGWTIDITFPTMMEGTTRLQGFKNGIKLPISYDDSGQLDIYLLLDE